MSDLSVPAQMIANERTCADFERTWAHSDRSLSEQTIWTPDTIRDLLDHSVLAVERAVVAIYNRQTADEQAAYETKHHNRVGFAACHAGLGTYYARWILSGKHLSGSHVERARKMVRHYAGQLHQIALSNTQTLEMKEYANVA